MSERANVIEVSGLTKVYQTARDRPPVRAVDGVDFTVRQGEAFGFLGPNGAGKTTTVRMLTGLTRPTAGRARVLGFDLATDVTRIKKRIGSTSISRAIARRAACWAPRSSAIGRRGSPNGWTCSPRRCSTGWR